MQCTLTTVSKLQQRWSWWLFYKGHFCTSSDIAINHTMGRSNVGFHTSTTLIMVLIALHHMMAYDTLLHFMKPFRWFPPSISALYSRAMYPFNKIIHWNGNIFLWVKCFVPICNGNCHFDSFRCSKLRKFRIYDDIFVWVCRLQSLKKLEFAVIPTPWYTEGWRNGVWQ